MSLANVVYVDVNSANQSELIFPSSSTTMFFQNNFFLQGSGNAFFDTSFVHEVLTSASVLNFWGKTSGKTYTNAWQSTYDSVTNKFSFETITNVSTTQLGDLQLWNNRSQLFIAEDPATTVTFDSPESVGQIIANILNGPTDQTGGASFTCPCQNTEFDAHCSWAAWGVIAQQIQLTLTKNLETFMAPCMNPGNTMVVNEGVGSLFNVAAQIKRIRNLNRVRFRTVQAIPKPCNNSLLYSLAAYTCGDGEKDFCPSFDPNTFSSCSTSISTRLGLDFSIQASVLGINVLDSTRLCDNLQPPSQGISCPGEADQCLEVYLPLMIVNATMEVPVYYASNSFQDAECELINPGSNTKAYRHRFESASFSMGLALSEKPVILYPTNTLLVPDEYKPFIETAIMDAANTVLKSSLDLQISEAFAPFFQEAFAAAPLFDDLKTCINMSQTAFTFPCPAGSIVVPPPQCDPCDFCCICLVGGDCGEKCMQRCGCVNTFCTAVDRVAYPIWWRLVLAFAILLVVLIVVFSFFVRGL